MTTKAKKNHYSKPFKEEAVALVLEQDYSVPDAAKALGIRPGLLYSWKQAIEEERAGQRLSSDERSELARLRRENKRLKMEQEILKKASAFFAQHMK